MYKFICLLLVAIIEGNVIPILYQPFPVYQSQPIVYNRLPAPYQPMPAPVNLKPAGGPCPISPYATHLSDDQQVRMIFSNDLFHLQQILHELITEARGQGADEPTVKQHINRYLQEILPVQKYEQLQEANRQFELHRISKRHAEEKQQPQKVFDLLDQYAGDNENAYAKFYEEYNAKKIRQFNNL